MDLYPYKHSKSEKDKNEFKLKIPKELTEYLDLIFEYNNLNIKDRIQFYKLNKELESEKDAIKLLIATKKLKLTDFLLKTIHDEVFDYFKLKFEDQDTDHTIKMKNDLEAEEKDYLKYLSDYQNFIRTKLSFLTKKEYFKSIFIVTPDHFQYNRDLYIKFLFLFSYFNINEILIEDKNSTFGVLKELLPKLEEFGITKDKIQTLSFKLNSSSYLIDDEEKAESLTNLKEIKIIRNYRMFSFFEIIDSFSRLKVIRKFINNNKRKIKIRKVTFDNFEKIDFGNSDMKDFIEAIFESKVNSIEFENCRFDDLPSFVSDKISKIKSLKINDCTYFSEFPKDLFKSNKKSLKNFEIVRCNFLSKLTEEDVENIKLSSFDNFKINMGNYYGIVQETYLSYRDMKEKFGDKITFYTTNENNVNEDGIVQNTDTEKFFDNTDNKGVSSYSTLQNIYDRMKTYCLSWNTEKIKNMKLEKITLEKKELSFKEIMKVLKNDLYEYIQLPVELEINTSLIEIEKMLIEIFDSSDFNNMKFKRMICFIFEKLLEMHEKNIAENPEVKDLTTTSLGISISFKISDFCEKIQECDVAKEAVLKQTSNLFLNKIDIAGSVEDFIIHNIANIRDDVFRKIFMSPYYSQNVHQINYYRNQANEELGLNEEYVSNPIFDNLAQNKDPFNRRKEPVIELFYINFRIVDGIDLLVNSINENENLLNILKTGKEYGVKSKDSRIRSGKLLQPYFEMEEYFDEDQNKILLPKKINKNGVLKLLLKYEIVTNNLIQNGEKNIPKFDSTFKLLKSYSKMIKGNHDLTGELSDETDVISQKIEDQESPLLSEDLNIEEDKNSEITTEKVEDQTIDSDIKITNSTDNKDVDIKRDKESQKPKSSKSSKAGKKSTIVIVILVAIIFCWGYFDLLFLV